MFIVDTHAHLDQIEDIETALNDAKAAGVVGIMAVGVDLAANKKNLELQARFDTPKIYVGLGIHPGNIIPEEIEATLDFIRANLARASAIGEVGLDFWYRWVKKNDEKQAQQKDVFRRQCELAKEAELPVIIHSRGAWQECFEIVKSLELKRAVFHWYSGPLEVLKDILNAGYFISATPSLEYSPQAREAVSYAPVEQTLIETDCPVFFRPPDAPDGFKAGPKDVVRTLRFYCELKNMDAEKAAAIFNTNTQTIFRISY